VDPLLAFISLEVPAKAKSVEASNSEWRFLKTFPAMIVVETD